MVEDMKKRGVVQQDARDKVGLLEESSERTGQPLLAGKICQDNKLMIMIMTFIGVVEMAQLVAHLSCIAQLY